MLLVAWIKPVILCLLTGLAIAGGISGMKFYNGLVSWKSDNSYGRSSDTPKPTFGVGGFILYTLLVTLVVLGISAGISSYYTVDKGHVGVVTQFGKITGRLLNPGLNWKSPFIDVVEVVSLRKHTYMAASEATGSADYMDYTIDTNTVDGQRIVISFQVKFQLDRAYAGTTLENYGSLDGLINNTIIPSIRSITRNVPKDYTAEELQIGASLASCEDDTLTALVNGLGDDGIIILSYEIRDIDFDPDYLQAIEDQQIAEEGIQTAMYEADAENERVRQAVIAAEGEAQQVVIAAQAEADAMLLRANAEAQAIATLGNALSRYPEYLQLQFIQTWSENIEWGILPDSVMPLMDMSTLTSE